MKKFIKLIVCFIFLTGASYALEIDSNYAKLAPISKRINTVGTQILNANKIDKRIGFAYKEKNNTLLGDPSVIKRQVVIDDAALSYVQDDNELAAYLSRGIALSLRSYDGIMGGFMDSAQVALSPKKYELAADVIAVDIMVKAGYNPVALITYINKACPQGKQDFISKHNLTSKRLARIYEHIYRDYPYFLVNNQYIDNPSYQNFLLTSHSNRELLLKSIKLKSRSQIKYE